MTRVKIDAVEDRGNTTDGAVFVRYSTHVDGGVYTASSALGGGGGSLSLSAGTSSAALGSVVFSNSNNVSFGLNGSTVTGSVLPPGGVSAGTASVQLGTVVFSNSNNVSFGLNGSTVTASATVASTAGSVSVSAGTSSAALGSVVFSNSNGVSFGLNGSTVTASVATALTSQSNQAVSAANGSFTFQTLSLSDANGISFGTSAGSAITASHNALTSQSNQAASASNGSFTFQTLNFSNANNVTFGTSAGGIVTASVAAPGGGGSATFSAGTSSAALASLVFSNSNGLSFGLNGSTITGSYTVPSGFLTAIKLSAGTSSVEHSAWTFANGNGVSFGMDGRTITGSHDGVNTISAANGSYTSKVVALIDGNGVSFSTQVGGGIKASHNALTSQSNQAVSAANGSSTFQTLSFANSNGVSFSTGTQGIYASVAAGGAVAASASNGSFTFQTLGFSNANNVTFGTSAGSIITASVAAPGGGGGGTVSQWPAEPWDVATSTAILGTTGGTGGSSQITASIYFTPFVMPVNLYFNHAKLMASMVTSAGTGSVTNAYQLGIYTKNGNTLSLSTSFMGGAFISQNSISNFSGLFWYGSTSNSWGLTYNNATNTTRSQFMTGLRDLVVTDKMTQTLTAGQYWIGVCFSRRSAGVNVWQMGNLAVLSQSQQTAGAVIYGSTVSQPPYALNNIQGVVSTSTNISATQVTAALLPDGIATASLNTTAWLWPAMKIHAGDP